MQHCAKTALFKFHYFPALMQGFSPLLQSLLFFAPDSIFSFWFTVGPILLTIPQYFAFTIKDHCKVNLNQTTIEDYKQNSSISFHTDGNNRTCIYSQLVYLVHYSDFGQRNEYFFFRFTVWLYSFILKFVPSIVLTVFTGFLIHALYKAEERSARLKQTRRTNVGAGPPGPQQQVQQPQVQSPPSPPIGKYRV